MRRSSIWIILLVGTAVLVPTALAQGMAGTSVARTTALPHLAIDRVAVHQRGLPAEIVVSQDGAVALKRGAPVRITMRVRNRGSRRLNGLRVSFSRYGGNQEPVQVLMIRALDPGQARMLTFRAMSRGRSMWVLRAGAILGGHFRNGATRITRVQIR
jgi:hypothetical protein